MCFGQPYQIKLYLFTKNLDKEIERQSGINSSVCRRRIFFVPAIK